MVHKSAVFLTSLAALVVALVVAGGASAITATTINACVDTSGTGIISDWIKSVTACP